MWLMMATEWIEDEALTIKEIKELGYAKTKIEKIQPMLF